MGKQMGMLIPGARVIVRDKNLGFVHGTLLEVDEDGYAVVDAEPIEGVEGPWEFPRRAVEVVG